MSDNEDNVTVAPAPGDVEQTLIERASARFIGRRSMTLAGGFSLATLRGEDDHEPFPLVRRRSPRGA